MELEQLLRAVQNNDESAIGPLSAMLLVTLNLYFRHRALSDADADDLTQTTLEVVLAKLPSLPEHPSLRGWLFTTAQNRALIHYHAEQRRFETSLGGADGVAQPGRGPSSELRHRELVGILGAELEQMDEAWRVVVQHDLDGGDPNVLAAQEGITPSGWRTRRQRGVAWLSERFETIFRKDR